MQKLIQKLKTTKLYHFLRRIYHYYKKRKAEYRRRKNQLLKEPLLQKLLQYDVISFDIFDTLITRKIYEPDDLFLLMNEKLKNPFFFKQRKEAEQRAREKLQKDVNLDEIYEYYQKINNISKKECEKIQNLEEALELKFTTPRIEMRNLVEELHQKKKMLIIISDMYLKKETILDMLKQCGYQINFFEAIYISNEENKRKDTKEIWPYIKKQYEKKSIIHIGDNNHSDVISPKEFGIHTKKVKSSKELFQESTLYPAIVPYLTSKSVSDSIFLGMMINHRLFNSPFHSLKIETIEDLGYAFHGTMIYEYLNFLEKESTSCDVLLFLAREGYNLQKLYQQFCEYKKIPEKKNVYFLTSRKSTTSATMMEEKDIIENIQKEFHGTFKDFMNQRFCIQVEDNLKINLPEDKEIVTKKVKPYQEEILKNAEQERIAYLEYIEKTIPNRKKKQLAILDLGYSGTIQYHLTKLLNQEMTGIYLTNSDTVKKYSEESKLLFCFDITKNDNYRFIYYYSLVLEFFLSAPYGQLQKFQKKGKEIIPVYNNETLDDDKRKSMDKIFESVTNYLKDRIELEENYNMKIKKELLVDWYKNLIDSFIIDRKVKDQFDFKDSFEASESRNVFQIISKY